MYIKPYKMGTKKLTPKKIKSLLKEKQALLKYLKAECYGFSQELVLHIQVLHEPDIEYLEYEIDELKMLLGLDDEN
jgi:hypothetical protein